MSSADELARHLAYVQKVLADAELWHCLAYGTLLGAVRDGDVIEWDDDIDLFIEPEEIDSIISTNKSIAGDGYRFEARLRPAGYLAVNPGRVNEFWDASVSILYEGEKIGDLYAFSLFDDGVLRRWDFKNQVYWCPRSSFPDWFLSEVEWVEMRGVSYPAPRDYEKWLEGVYGEDWRVPYKASRVGGTIRPNTTTHGDKFLPKLHAEIAWCRSRGWDQHAYRNQPTWPRSVNGAGPKGPTERTFRNSRSLWWRDIDELLRYY
jgi:hypothetical protein